MPAAAIVPHNPSHGLGHGTPQGMAHNTTTRLGVSHLSDTPAATVNLGHTLNTNDAVGYVVPIKVVDIETLIFERV